MAFIRNTYREPKSSRIYIPTGRDISFQAGYKEQAYWTLAGWIPEGGATIADIYHNILAPKGLTLDNTRELVKGAVTLGYLE